MLIALIAVLFSFGNTLMHWLDRVGPLIPGKHSYKARFYIIRTTLFILAIASFVFALTQSISSAHAGMLALGANMAEASLAEILRKLVSEFNFKLAFSIFRQVALLMFTTALIVFTVKHLRIDPGEFLQEKLAE